MVSLKSILTLSALALSQSATASPVTGSSSSSNNIQNLQAAALEARQDGWAEVFFCEHINWGGECYTLFGAHNTCFDIPQRWDNRISSIENKTSQLWRCTWYEHFGCTGDDYSNQRDANLADGSGNMNDKISSYKCWIR